MEMAEPVPMSFAPPESKCITTRKFMLVNDIDTSNVPPGTGLRACIIDRPMYATTSVAVPCPDFDFCFILLVILVPIPYTIVRTPPLSDRDHTLIPQFREPDTA